MTQYWVVWQPNSGAPTRKHFSKLGAELEAERLARLNRCHTFVVLEAIGEVVATDLRWERP